MRLLLDSERPTSNSEQTRVQFNYSILLLLKVR